MMSAGSGMEMDHLPGAEEAPLGVFPLSVDRVTSAQEDLSKCRKFLSELANFDTAKFLELERLKAEQAQENQLLKQQMADLAKDNRSLQEKNKLITKKHRDEMERFKRMLKDADKQLAKTLQ